MELSKDITGVIKKVFGDDNEIISKKFNNLPLIYDGSFRYFEIKGSFDFTLIVPNESDTPFDLLKACYLKIQEVVESRVVLYLFESSKSNKQFFIDSKISFLSSDYDYRLFNDVPVLYTNPFTERVIKEKYTKKTQLLVNFYLTNDIKEYSTREVAKELNQSYSSVSRSNVFLHEIGALSKVGISNSSKYSLRSKKEFLEKVKPYLIYPIRDKRMVILNKNSINNICSHLSGDNALSYYTDLLDNFGYIELAFDKDSYQSLKSLINDIDGEIVCYLEEFSFFSAKIAEKSPISILEAYIIASKRYANSSDPRIRQAIKSLERKLINL